MPVSVGFVNIESVASFNALNISLGMEHFFLVVKYLILINMRPMYIKSHLSIEN